MYVNQIILKGTCQTAKVGSTTKLTSYVNIGGSEESVRAAISKVRYILNTHYYKLRLMREI